MSFLVFEPDAVAATRADLGNEGAAVEQACASAALRTTTIAAPAADEISAAITGFMASHAREFQSAAAAASSFRSAFAGLLAVGSARYQAAEQGFNVSLGGLGSAVLNGSGNSLNGSLNTVFGSQGFSMSMTGTALGGGNGPFGAHLTTFGPFGDALLTLNGTFSNGGNIATFTGGTLQVPGWLPILSAVAGPYVTGGNSLVNSLHAFHAATSGGDYLQAGAVMATTPPAFLQAVLFGQQTVPLVMRGSPWVLNMPFGGVFAPLQPATLTILPQTYGVMPYGYQINGSTITLQGTGFGGLVPELIEYGVSAV